MMCAPRRQRIPQGVRLPLAGTRGNMQRGRWHSFKEFQMSDVVRQQTVVRQLTLPELLKRVAYAEVPSRFYAVLQVCAPFAVQFWAWGWHRTAGWLGVASVFGL